mgnify:CR=1 FL=1
MGAALIVFGVTFAQCMNRVEPDYSVILSIGKTVPSAAVEEISSYLEGFGTDQNDDGEVYVQIIDVSVSETAGNPQLVQGQRTKLMAELQTGNALLFLTDNGQFEYLDGEIGLFQKLDFLTAREGKAFNWNGTAFEKAINKDSFFPEDLYLSLRAVKGSTAEKLDKNTAARETAAKALLKKLAEAK